jgi:hypothetical protein
MKSFLNRIKTLWLSFALKLAKVNTVILLSLVYFIVIGCMALIARILGKDLLQKRINSHKATYWRLRVTTEPTINRNKFQF